MKWLVLRSLTPLDEVGILRSIIFRPILDYLEGLELSAMRKCR